MTYTITLHVFQSNVAFNGKKIPMCTATSSRRMFLHPELFDITSWQNRKEKSVMILRFVYVQREVAGRKPAYISNPVARQSFPWISCIYYRTISANITIIAKYCKLDLDRHLDLVLHLDLDLRLDVVFVYIESNIVACTTITKYQHVCTAFMPKWLAKP